MTKLVSDNNDNSRIIEARHMKPLQVARIVDEDSCYRGTLVMRTASFDKFEVMAVSDAEEDFCWTDPECDLLVELFPPGVKIILEFYNE